MEKRGGRGVCVWGGGVQYAIKKERHTILVFTMLQIMSYSQECGFTLSNNLSRSSPFQLFVKKARQLSYKFHGCPSIGKTNVCCVFKNALPLCFFTRV